MSKNKLIGRIEQKESELKVAHFKRCPLCRCEDLLKFEMDCFCMKCDWTSILFDVHSGNFEKRIGIKNRQRRKHGKANSHDSVIHLEDLWHERTQLSAQAKSSEAFQNSELRKTGGLK